MPPEAHNGELAELVRAAVFQAVAELRDQARLPELLSVAQVGDLVGCSPRTVWRLASASRMTGFPTPLRIGKSAKWKRCAVEAWVAALDGGDVVELG